jgi:uncharacterized protein (TIGR03437 family)
MYRRVTLLRTAVLGLASAGLAALAQIPAAGPQLDWRHIGNSAIELALPSAATGPVDRVWYSSDGATLYARTRSGRTFQTADFETWAAVSGAPSAPPPAVDGQAPNSPETGARARSMGARMYSFARNAFRSDDGGINWVNLTAYKGASILGASLSDLAVSPPNEDEISVANAAGVWRSMDGGLTWSGLNASLPNLPVRRFFGLPSGMNGVRIGLALNGASELEWAPGEKIAWRVSNSPDPDHEALQKRLAAQALNAVITAVATSGDAIYAGSADGRLWASLDGGARWGPASIRGGPVEAIYVDPKDPQTAWAVLGDHPKPLEAGATPEHVVTTKNAGGFWDDATGNLPDVSTHGVTADTGSSAVYVASDAGVFFASTDSSGRAGPWTLVSAGLPNAPAMDVKLDAAENQIFAALDGYGVYATMAPHRLREVRVVNAADFSGRAAAPGSLLSVLGTRLTSARTGESAVPILAADNNASQIQVPFNAKGQNLGLALESAAGHLVRSFPLRNVSPAIFIDPDGAPMVLDGDSGVMLDAMRPAHSGTRVQVLATGLGRVNPDWPTGTPAPLTDSPRVIAPLRAYLDREAVEVSRAVLAPGYVGFYLIEIQLPRIVNAGPAELYIEAEGQPSNRVRLYIEP